MIRSHYLELSIAPSFYQEQHKKPAVVKWFELVLNFIHAVQVRNGVANPISFPDYKKGDFSMLGKRFRIFGEEEKLKIFLDEILQHNFFSEIIKVQNIEAVPEEVDGWFIYTREHFPKRNKMKHKNYLEKVKNFESLPQIKLQSDSNKNWFVIGIEKREASIEEFKKFGGRATTYGFSHKNDVLALPDFK